MKIRNLFIAVGAAALISLSACSGGTEVQPPEFTTVQNPAAAVADSFNRNHSDESTDAVTATSVKELKKILAGNAVDIRFESENSKAVTVKGNSDYTKNLTVSVASDFKNKTAFYNITVEKAGGKFINEVPVCELDIIGDDVNAELKSGAGLLYVEGKNVVVTLSDGDYPTVIVVNDTAVIINNTDNSVNVTLPNGVQVELSPGKTFSSFAVVDENNGPTE